MIVIGHTGEPCSSCQMEKFAGSQSSGSTILVLSTVQLYHTPEKYDVSDRHGMSPF